MSGRMTPAFAAPKGTDAPPPDHGSDAPPPDQGGEEGKVGPALEQP